MFDGHHSLSFKMAGFVLAQNAILAALFFYVSEDAAPFEMLGMMAVLIVLTCVTLLFVRDVVNTLKTLVRTASDLAAGRPAVAVEETKRRDEIGMIARHLEDVSRHHLTRLIEADNTREEQARQMRETGTAAIEAANVEVRALRSVVEALDGGMRRLAVGDLTARLDMPFPEELEGLRADFNHALATLEDTICQIGGSASALHGDCAETKSMAEAAADCAARQTAALATTVNEVNTLAETLRTRRMQAGHTANIAYNARTDICRPKDAIATAAGALKTIRKTSRETELATATIRELAFEANMLALNTGIEAAHNGEHGATDDRLKARAEDIRILAEKAAEAAKQISGLSRSTAEAAERADVSIDTAGGEIDAMTIYVEALKGHVDIIAASSTREIETVAAVRTMVMAITKASRDQLGTLDMLTARIGGIQGGITAVEQRAERFTPVTILVEGGVSTPQSTKPRKRGSHLRLVKS